MKIFGLDVSLDHGGVVVLDENGKVIDYRYLTTVKKMVDVDSDHSILLSKRGKDESKDVFRLRRMKEYLHGLMDFERKTSSIDGASRRPFQISSYYSVEGYSYASKSTSICQIAELTGYLKYSIFRGGGKIRIHEPKSVKLFATNNGGCLKKDMIKQASLKFDIPEGLAKIKRSKKKKSGLVIEDLDGPATDLADAYFLAIMLYVELKVRSGELTLDKLSDGGRRVFLRVTKAYPVNILDRQFICKGDGE